MSLSLAVAAKGHCQPQDFFAALDEAEMLESPELEIIIAHDEPWPMMHATLPRNVRLCACPRGTSILKLWGIAMGQGTQPFVAALDLRCPPQPAWWSRVRQEIERGTPVFFGPVDPGWNECDARITGYVAEYVQFHSPLASSLDEVPGNNIVCRRDLLETPDKLAADGFFKTFLIWKLARKQQLAPQGFDDMVVVYRKPFLMGHYAKRRYIHGRCFAASRFDNPGQPPRLMCLAFTPVLPWLRVWRIYRAVARHRDMKRAFFRQLPRVILSEFAWSAGEFMGYGFGGRDYCDHLD